MTRAVVLHRWPWQEHGLLLDLFTEDSGRVRAISKYARSRRSSLRATLEPFTLIEIELKGRGEVKTLARAESLQHFPLRYVNLYSGLYLNELLQRLLPELTDLPNLFTDYVASLELLSEAEIIEPILRQFEYRLLCHLDLDFSFTHDAESGSSIEPNSQYRFVPGSGFIPVRLGSQTFTVNENVADIDSSEWLLLGAEIEALGQLQLANPKVLKQFKRLMRNAYTPLLGAKPLRSRELLMAALQPK